MLRSLNILKLLVNYHIYEGETESSKNNIFIPLKYPCGQQVPKNDCQPIGLVRPLTLSLQVHRFLAK